MAKSIAEAQVARKFKRNQLGEQPLFAANPEAALPSGAERPGLPLFPPRPPPTWLTAPDMLRPQVDR